MPVVAGIALLFTMVSRLANEVDKLETTLEESTGKINSLGQRADELKQANQSMTDSLIQVKCYAQSLQCISGPEQERLLLEMNNALDSVINNAVTELNFIDHRPMPGIPLSQNLHVAPPSLVR